MKKSLILALILCPISLLYVQNTGAESYRPGDVTNLKATAGDASIYLEWDPVSSMVELNNYFVFCDRSEKDAIAGDYEKKFDVGLATNATVSKGVKNDITYYCSVNALDVNGEKSENFSDIVSVTPMAKTVVSSPVPSTASSPTINYNQDVPFNHYAYDAVWELSDKGIIDLKINYEPWRQVNRAEILKMVIVATGGFDSPPLYNFHYADVSENDWFNPYISIGRNRGIVQGYSDNTFRPNMAVNRAEAAKIFQVAFDIPFSVNENPSFDDVYKNNWFYKYVEALSFNGITQGKKYRLYKPGDPLNRGEAAVMISRALKK